MRGDIQTDTSGPFRRPRARPEWSGAPTPQFPSPRHLYTEIARRGGVAEHLEKTDGSYRVFLYIFYTSAAIMVGITAFGIWATTAEWLENGTYVMGEVIHNTAIPFENFARLSSWLFFSSIIGWYCVSRIGWKRTVAGKIPGRRMALLQLMLLGFVIISLYEVLYNFTVLNAAITAGMAGGATPDIDRLSIAYPDPNAPWNLVFATKIFLAAFIISGHALYLSTRPRKRL